MKFKCKALMKFLVLGSAFMTLEIRLIHSLEQTVQLLRQSSDVFGKTGSEAEMAYFTQIFGFVNDRDEFGNSMLNFLKKYLKMINGKQVSRNKHWKNDKDVHYILRGNHCYNYLADDLLIRSGIQYDTAQLFVTENKFNVKLDYYTYDTFQSVVLRCRVQVYHKPTYLYFMKFTNDENNTDSSYFMLASKPSSEPSTLSIIMYTNRRLARFYDKELREFPPSLVSVDEDEDLDENTVPRIVEDGEIDFRKLLIAPDRYLKEGNNRVILFGKDAERVFITSNSFRFIDLRLKNSYVDKFIQFVQKMKKGWEIIQSVSKVTQYEDAEYKVGFCARSILSNAALQFHGIIPVLKPPSEITVSTREAIFPRTRLPGIKFSFPTLKCPALVGDERKPIIIYVQWVAYSITRGKYRNFALLKSRKYPGTVYPVTLTEQKYDFGDPSARESVHENVPSIYEDEELGPVIEEQGEASTSSAHSLPDT